MKGIAMHQVGMPPPLKKSTLETSVSVERENSNWKENKLPYI
jgi:hypothetical protein